jgi:hypothetical protein
MLSTAIVDASSQDAPSRKDGVAAAAKGGTTAIAAAATPALTLSTLPLLTKIKRAFWKVQDVYCGYGGGVVGMEWVLWVWETVLSLDTMLSYSCQ